MQIRILVLVGLALLLLVFQLAKNEFIEPNPAFIKDEFTIQQQKLPFRVSLRPPASAESLYLLNARNNAVMDQSRLREKLPYYYKFKISPEIQKSLKLTALDYLENPIESIQHCLTVELAESLKSLLDEAQICESPEIEEAPSHIYCQTNYTLPYGILIFADGQRFNLGEKQTSCDFPTSLCGDYNQKMMDWTRQVLLGIKNLKCENEKSLQSEF